MTSRATGSGLLRLSATLKSAWLSLRRNAAARNSLAMVGGRGGMVLLQALQFVLLARILGAHEFGRVASATAITSALLPFSGLGLGNVAIARIARAESTPQRCLGNALLVTTFTGTVAVILAVVTAAAFLHDPQAGLLALLLGVSEILCTKYVDIAAHIYMGLEEHPFSAAFYNFHLLLRVVVAAVLPWVFAQPTGADWAYLHLASGAAAAAVVLLVTVRRLGRPHTALHEALRDAKMGVHFAITLAARSVQTDSDKSFLARDVSAEVAGLYTGAFRVVAMACIPIVAIQSALLARTFRDGHRDGLAGALAGLRPLLLGGIAYGGLLAGALYLAAPLMPWLLGPSYSLSSEILRSLCVLPLLYVTQSVFTQILSATDVLRSVGAVHAAAAVMTVALNALLVPSQGWMGSCAAAYVSQAFLLIGLWLLATRQLRRDAASAKRGGTDLPAGPA